MKADITNKTKRPAHPIKARLSKDVHIILASCLHQFELQDRFGEEECFDVDGILAGRTVAHREQKRRFERAKAADSYREPVSHGTFIPHAHLFKSVVKAHS